MHSLFLDSTVVHLEQNVLVVHPQATENTTGKDIIIAGRQKYIVVQVAFLHFKTIWYNLLDFIRLITYQDSTVFIALILLWTIKYYSCMPNCQLHSI